MRRFCVSADPSKAQGGREGPTPDPVEPEEAEGAEEQPSDTSQTPQTPPNTDQPKLSAKERVENSDWFKKLAEDVPGTWVDEHGNIHSPAFDGSSGDILG